MLFLLPFSASAVNITCVYNVDTGVLEATQPWRNTLGAIADRICLSAGRPLQQNQPIAAQSQAVFRADRECGCDRMRRKWRPQNERGKSQTAGQYANPMRTRQHDQPPTRR